MSNPKMYRVVLTGGPTRLIIHADNLAGQAKIEEWTRPNKDKKQVKGDDRCPPWGWRIYLYTDGEHVVLPSANVQSCITTGSAEFKLEGKRSSLKRTSAAALRFPDEFLTFIPAGRKKPIGVEEIDAIDQDMPFDDQCAAALKLGILLDVRRATVGQSKHVRVRPCFPAGWRAEGTLINSQPDLIGAETLGQIMTLCGNLVGLGDWRPSSPKRPGPHGRFTSMLSGEGK